VRFREQVLIYAHEICKRKEFISPCPSDGPEGQMAVHVIASGSGGALFVGIIANYLTLIINDLPT
jgi:hypothetical protein